MSEDDGTGNFIHKDNTVGTSNENVDPQHFSKMLKKTPGPYRVHIDPFQSKNQWGLFFGPRLMKTPWMNAHFGMKGDEIRNHN